MPFRSRIVRTYIYNIRRVGKTNAVEAHARNGAGLANTATAANSNSSCQVHLLQ